MKPQDLREFAGIRGDGDAKAMLDAADEIERLRAEIKRLRAAGHDGFMAMCAYRDNDDREVFQDAIDALGQALKSDTGG